MRHTSVDIITISRQFGSGGSELARAVATRLGWPVLDRDLIRLVAKQLQLDDHVVEGMDEQPPSFMRRLAAALLIAPPEMPVGLDTEGLLDVDAVAATARSVIERAAQAPPVIIVGHGGQRALHDRPGTLHVRVVAPIADRVDRVCRRLACDGKVAVAEVQRMDDARRQYIRRYYHCDWQDPLLYDVQVNTGRVAIGAAAEVLEHLVNASRASLAATASS